MKKNIVFIGISVSLLILLGIGVSYSLWNMSNTQNTENVISTTDCFDISITSEENSISLKNSYPISDEKGKKLTPFTFKVTNKCETAAKYSINLESLNGSTLSSEYLDIMLNNGEIKRLNSYSSTDKVNSSSVESRELETGILGNKESRDYSLRLWIDYDTTMEDLNNETKVLKSKIVIIGKPINYTGDTVFNFDYTGSEQTFTAPVSGTYKLETWGAQGGQLYANTYTLEGGTGGYSMGFVNINQHSLVYVIVGGTGTAGNTYQDTTQYIGIGGYNGGGNGGLGLLESDEKYYSSGTGGGGATHISTKSGLLSSLENYKDTILIVSGGGGGYGMHSFAGQAGGFKGTSSFSRNYVYEIKGANQTGGYKFGIGQDAVNQKNHNSIGAEGRGGGGGGYYGGFSYTGDEHDYDDASGSGGSGYIGNSLLKNKVMFCYNCEESSDESTKTISTTCSEETPISYCAKKGNGYARITLVSINE